jgi:hypothetical protein
MICGNLVCLARTVRDMCRSESCVGAVIAAKASIANKTETQGCIGDCFVPRSDGFRRDGARNVSTGDVSRCMGDCGLRRNDVRVCNLPRCVCITKTNHGKSRTCVCIL